MNTKNIKKPAYAVELGKGMFAGANWQCTKCGYVVRNYTTRPILSGCDYFTENEPSIFI